MRPDLTLVAAVARNRVMGAGGQLPWDLPEDRAHFRRVTLGHAVIMGRRTWDETGVPLDGRRNIVVSRAGAVSGAGREIARSLNEAVALARTSDPDPRVIGGAEIFRVALPSATAMILTEIDFDAAGDTYFPAFAPAQWHLARSVRGDRATYCWYERVADI